METGFKADENNQHLILLTSSEVELMETNTSPPSERELPKHFWLPRKLN